MQEKKLNIHGWVYDISNGEIVKTERSQKS
jgi:carbonic anhydrase